MEECKQYEGQMSKVKESIMRISLIMWVFVCVVASERLRKFRIGVLCVRTKVSRVVRLCCCHLYIQVHARVCDTAVGVGKMTYF